jgi:tripartite-type tricarboxylate transporter receptor subunit TctC
MRIGLLGNGCAHATPAASAVTTINRTRTKSLMFFCARMTRTLSISACVFALLLISHASAFAQAYPTRPIRLVVPFPPGGTIDMVGRIVAQTLGERVGQSVVVDNRAGAGGIIGVDTVAKAAPDGHTLCLCSSGTLITSPMLLAKPPYDARRDFAPITTIASVPYLLLVRPGAGIASVKDLITLAKQKPGTLDYGSAGNGSTSHLAAAMFAWVAGIDVVHVPYKGSAPAATDLMGGQLSFVFEAIGAATQYAKSERLRALGISTLKRSPSLPEIPSISEAGAPGYQMTTWHSVCAPAATPPSIIAKLNREIVSGMNETDARNRLTALGTELYTGTPEELRALITTEVPRWKKLLAQMRIVADSTR